MGPREPRKKDHQTEGHGISNLTKLLYASGEELGPFRSGFAPRMWHHSCAAIWRGLGCEKRGPLQQATRVDTGTLLPPPPLTWMIAPVATLPRRQTDGCARISTSLVQKDFKKEYYKKLSAAHPACKLSVYDCAFIEANSNMIFRRRRWRVR